MRTKIHVRANKGIRMEVFARCAARPVAGGKVKLNRRRSYANMSSQIVDPITFARTAPEQRCAHCCGMLLARVNSNRKEAGRPTFTDIRQWAAHVITKHGQEAQA